LPIQFSLFPWHFSTKELNCTDALKRAYQACSAIVPGLSQLILSVRKPEIFMNVSVLFH
jgi:hypothetical protein